MYLNPKSCWGARQKEKFRYLANKHLPQSVQTARDPIVCVCVCVDQWGQMYLPLAIVPLKSIAIDEEEEEEENWTEKEGRSVAGGGEIDEGPQVVRALSSDRS